MNQMKQKRKHTRQILALLVVLIMQFLSFIPLAHAEGEFVEFFEELLFGSGALFGLLLIFGLCIMFSYRFKYASVFCIFVMVILNFEYWGQIGDKISVSSMFMWSIVMSYVGIFILIGLLWRDLRS